VDLAREKFVDHFEIVLDVQCFSRWPKRGRSRPPTWLSGCFYQWMRTSAGDIQATERRFIEVVDSLIAELHETAPRGEAPKRKVVAGLLYDRLSAAGIEVRIRPPLQGHSV
jgi:hypothetical protein